MPAERSVAARPGMVPAARRTAGTMVAALYGRVVPHAWRDPESEHDAYQLFHQRSAAMGWLDDTAAGGGSEEGMLRAAGLWAMNDAGWSHQLAGPGLVSWFQVEAQAVAGDRPLPVQPFLRCAADTTARAGTLDLTTVQVLLPVQGLAASSRPRYAPVPAVLTARWFAETDPQARTPVEVGVSSGRDGALAAVAPRLVEQLGALAREVFVAGSHEVGGPGAVLPPPLDDSLWNGPALHGLVLRGELSEWSCDAAGWLAEVVADVAARLGVRTPLVFTVTRDGG